MHTRDQRYAARAMAQISQDIEHRSKSERDKYGSMAHKLPVLIRTSGLCQSLAFVQARGDDMHRTLLGHLAATLEEGTAENLLTLSRTESLGAYMGLTQRVLAALLWYKRFAQSVLDVEADAGEGDVTP